MNNYEIVEKGNIILGDRVMVSDPCYGLGTWCQGVLENVLPGKYVCKVAFTDEGDWGTRVADIRVEHVDYKVMEFDHMEDFEVGVDSGQAGIYDYEYYAKYHADSSEKNHVDDEWYDKVGNLTYTTEVNPNYERFIWKPTTGMSTEELLIEFERYNKYQNDWNKSNLYFHKLDANTIDDLGFVSSSGYGDGGYTCWTSHNDDGKVIGILVEFITEDDEDEEDY